MLDKIIIQTITQNLALSSSGIALILNLRQKLTVTLILSLAFILVFATHFFIPLQLAYIRQALVVGNGHDYWRDRGGMTPALNFLTDPTNFEWTPLTYY